MKSVKLVKKSCSYHIFPSNYFICSYRLYTYLYFNFIGLLKTKYRTERWIDSQVKRYKNKVKIDIDIDICIAYWTMIVLVLPVFVHCDPREYCVYVYTIQ